MVTSSSQCFSAAVERIVRGQLPEEKITLYRFITDFLAWSMATQSIYTYKSHRSALDKLQTILDDFPIDAIGGQATGRLAALCLSNNLKRASVNTMLRHIKDALGKASEWYTTT